MADSIFVAPFQSAVIDSGIKGYQIQGTFDSDYQTDGSPWQIGTRMLTFADYDIPSTATMVGFCGSFVLNNVSWRNKRSSTATRWISLWIGRYPEPEFESNSSSSASIGTIVSSTNVISQTVTEIKLYCRTKITNYGAWYLNIGSTTMYEDEELSFNATIDGYVYNLSAVDNSGYDSNEY
jgi:hypothetical protein